MQGAFAARVVVRFDGAVLEDRYVGYTDAPLRVLLPSDDELRFVDVHPGALGDAPLEVAEGAFSLHAQIASPPRALREGRRAWTDKAALMIVASLVSLAFVAPFAIVFGAFEFGWSSAASLHLPDDVIRRARENALTQAHVTQLYPSVHYAASGPRSGAAKRSRALTSGPTNGPRHARAEALRTDDLLAAIPHVTDNLLAAFVEPTPAGDALGSIGGGDSGGGDAEPTPVASKDHDDLDTISLGTIGTIARDSGVGSDQELGEPYHVGDLGAGGGGGDGEGYGNGDHCLVGRSPCHVPDLVPGTAAVHGIRDKESIRRVIRAHLNEVRFCYESNAQSADADLRGRLLVDFVIASSGEVIAVQSARSGLANAGAAGARTARCVTRAFGRWRFGNVPSIGVTRVSYPFQFELAVD